MSDPSHDHQKTRADLSKRVKEKELRKLRARRHHDSVWFGLGTFGVIGWSVAIPMLIGILVGVWIDTNWPSQFSWTMMLLFIGVVLGCLNAWNWISREAQMIEEEEKDDDE